MRDWKKVTIDSDIYFCDPHSPWQLTMAAWHPREHWPSSLALPEALTCGAHRTSLDWAVAGLSDLAP